MNYYRMYPFKNKEGKMIDVVLKNTDTKIAYPLIADNSD